VRESYHRARGRVGNGGGGCRLLRHRQDVDCFGSLSSPPLLRPSILPSPLSLPPPQGIDKTHQSKNSSFLSPALGP
jgi:hypothetical protein